MKTNTAKLSHARGLSMRTHLTSAISNRWPHVGHCRLVFFRINFFLFFLFFFSYITWHSNHRMCQKKVLGWSYRILSGFRKDLVGNTIITYIQSSYHANKLHIYKWWWFYFIFLYNPELHVMFVLLQIFVSAADRIDSKTLCWEKKKILTGSI